MNEFTLTIPASQIGTYQFPEMDVVFRRSTDMIGMEVLYMQYDVNGKVFRVLWGEADPALRTVAVLSINAFRQGYNLGRKKS